MFNNPLSLGYLTIPEAGPAEIVEAAAAAGFFGTSLRIDAAGPLGGPSRLIGNPPAIRETLRAIADTGVVLHDFEMIRMRADLKPSDHEETLDTGARLGGRFIIVLGDDDDENRLTDNMAAVCELARDRGVRVVIEFMSWLGVSRALQAQRIVKNTRKSNAGIVVYPLHVVRGGGSMAELTSLDPSHLFFCQICDARADRPDGKEALRHEALWDRLHPGDGALPLADYVRSMPEDIPISVETPVLGLDKSLSVNARAKLAYDSTRALLHRLKA
jgi:sugar phosphate isomerase/epimerase